MVAGSRHETHVSIVSSVLLVRSCSDVSEILKFTMYVQACTLANLSLELSSSATLGEGVIVCRQFCMYSK